jgi:hypothetical protein
MNSKPNGMIEVLVRTASGRGGTWHHGRASPKADWRDVVRHGTLVDLDRVISAEVVMNKRGRAKHWLVIVK